MRLPTYEDVRRYGPTIGTIFSCVGTIATGVLSARAMYKYMKATEFPCDNTKEAMKAAIPPVLMGAATITSFILVRRADSRAIASLSASVAALSMQLHETRNEVIEEFGEDKAEELFQKVDYKLMSDDADVVIDPDGELYYIADCGLMIQATEATMTDAALRVNRNYQIRGGMASLYEFLRFIGVKKRDIKSRGLDWTEYIGWHALWLDQYGYAFIDILTPENDGPGIQDGCYKDVIFETPLMPICIDPPDRVHMMCHTDEEDLSELMLDRDDVHTEICMEIRDDDEE